MTVYWSLLILKRYNYLLFVDLRLEWYKR